MHRWLRVREGIGRLDFADRFKKHGTEWSTVATQLMFFAGFWKPILGRWRVADHKQILQVPLYKQAYFAGPQRFVRISHNAQIVHHVLVRIL